MIQLEVTKWSQNGLGDHTPGVCYQLGKGRAASPDALHVALIDGDVSQLMTAKDLLELKVRQATILTSSWITGSSHSSLRCMDVAGTW